MIFLKAPSAALKVMRAARRMRRAPGGGYVAERKKKREGEVHPSPGQYFQRCRQCGQTGKLHTWFKDA